MIKLIMKKKLECNVCSLTFMWPYSLRNHFERKHGAVKVTTTSGFGLFEKIARKIQYQIQMKKIINPLPGVITNVHIRQM